MEKKKIQILGSGCPACKGFFETVKKIVEELKIEADVEYITDVEKIIGMGVISVPALSIDNKIVLKGGFHSIKKIKEILLQAFLNNNIIEDKDNDDCDCDSDGCSRCKGCC